MMTATALPPAEDFIPLDDAPAHIPGRPHRSTVWRWCSRGVVRNGQPVRLRYLNAGVRRMTTLAWIAEFLAALNADNGTLTETDDDRARRAAEAGRALEALGA